MRHLNLRAILAGFIVTTLLDMAIGLLVTALWPTDSSGEDIPIYLQSGYLTVALILGTFTTVVGGAICALKSPKLPYWNAATLGALGMLFGALLHVRELPMWYVVPAYLLNIPAALAGARLALERQRSRQ